MATTKTQDFSGEKFNSLPRINRLLDSSTDIFFLIPSVDFVTLQCRFDTRQMATILTSHTSPITLLRWVCPPAVPTVCIEIPLLRCTASSSRDTNPRTRYGRCIHCILHSTLLISIMGFIFVLPEDKICKHITLVFYVLKV